jgi:hypothetical protein
VQREVGRGGGGGGGEGKDEKGGAEAARRQRRKLVFPVFPNGQTTTAARRDPRAERCISGDDLSVIRPPLAGLSTVAVWMIRLARSSPASGPSCAGLTGGSCSATIAAARRQERVPVRRRDTIVVVVVARKEEEEEGTEGARASRGRSRVCAMR